MKYFWIAALILLVSAGISCSHHPVKASTPPPPVIEEKPRQLTYPAQARPKPKDIVVHNCTLTTSLGNKADCICRNASTKIDVKDQSKNVWTCK